MGMEWGAATAEFASEEKNQATHILVHDLTSADKAERSMRFALARVRWFSAKMPPGGTQEVWFDDRGQTVPAGVRETIRKALTPPVAGIMFFSEGEA